VEVYKGPYFVQFGDSNTAGAVNIVTKRRDKDTTFTITGGSYNQQRYLGILSPPEGTPLTPYIGFEAYHDLGPFKNPENFNRFNLSSNFTFFLNDPVNGDEIEQTDKRILGGSYLNYRRNYSLLDIPTETLVGFSTRSDLAHVGLFHDKRRQRLSTTTDSFIKE